MVNFLNIFWGWGVGGGRFWHLYATYNVVLLNDLHKHAQSINCIFLTFFMKFNFLSLKKEMKKKKKKKKT